jgi:hypothetical protein
MERNKYSQLRDSSLGRIEYAKSITLAIPVKEEVIQRSYISLK